MPYVMVPVPEEYVTEVMQLVVDMAKKGVTGAGMEQQAAERKADESEPSATGSPGG
jgi:hypothetical protein